MLKMFDRFLLAKPLWLEWALKNKSSLRNYKRMYDNYPRPPHRPKNEICLGILKRQMKMNPCAFISVAFIKIFACLVKLNTKVKLNLTLYS